GGDPAAPEALLVLAPGACRLRRQAAAGTLNTGGTPMAGDQRVERRPLTRRRIVEAALAIVDERGLPDLTMRRLGARLGVEAMSIYKHLPSKEAVIEGVRELLLDELAQLRAEHP